MLRRATLMLTLAAITAVVLALGAGGAAVAGKPPSGEPSSSGPIECEGGKVCQGTPDPDVILGSGGNDNIRPMGGDDYVFGNGGNDEVAHSYGDDRIFGGCGSDTVRAGFGKDRTYANMPKSWPLLGTDSPCANITTATLLPKVPRDKTFETLAQAEGDDVPDSAHDLVDCAWLASRGDPEPDVGFGSVEVPAARNDTVVDCSNRDDSATGPS